MTRKDKHRRHQRRIHEQKQHKVRRLQKEIRRNLSECEIVLKKRKKKFDTHIDAEMAKRGFERVGENWRRLTNA